MVADKPYMIVWICTARCNLDCVHCYVKNRFKGPELEGAEVSRFIEGVASLKPRFFSITGGEPFLRKDIVDILRACRDYGLTTSIVTNGLIMTEELASKISSLETFLYVSLDGATRRSCEELRGRGVWGRIMKTLEIIRRNNVEFATVMTITSKNYNETRSFIELSEELGATHAAIIPLIPAGAARLRKELNPSPIQVWKAFKKAEETADERGYDVSIWCAPFAKAFIKSKHVYVGSCRYNNMDIDPSGNVLICDVLDVTITNIRKGVQEAWREYVENPLVLELEDPSKMKGACSNCKHLEKCSGGCRARSYLTYGTYYLPDPLCPIHKSNNQH